MLTSRIQEEFEVHDKSVRVWVSANFRRLDKERLLLLAQVEERTLKSLIDEALQLLFESRDRKMTRSKKP